jgi:hypothetical protein
VVFYAGRLANRQIGRQAGSRSFGRSVGRAASRSSNIVQVMERLSDSTSFLHSCLPLIAKKRERESRRSFYQVHIQSDYIFQIK